MRVLYLNPFSQQVSGPDESLLTLLEHLIPMGVEAHLVLPRPGPQVPRYEALGVRVHFAHISILSRKMGARGAALYAARLARGALAVARVARAMRVDLIHTNMEVVLDGGIAARCLGLPHVFHYRGNTRDEPRFVFDVLTWLWTHLADQVFCISDSTAAIFRRRGRDASVETLYNPVNVAHFAGAETLDELRAEFGAAPGDFLVGTVARIHPRKDLETFVRSAALVAVRCPRSRFIVVGGTEGPEEEAYLAGLRKLAADSGIIDRLHFAGPRRDMPQVLKALDVFVLCSRHEGFGRVAAEAMAAGLPSVLTREGAFPEMLEEGRQGFLASPERPGEFANAVVRLLEDAPLRAAMGASGSLRACSFSVHGIATRVHSRYSELLST